MWDLLATKFRPVVSSSWLLYSPKRSIFPQSRWRMSRRQDCQPQMLSTHHQARSWSRNWVTLCGRYFGGRINMKYCFKKRQKWVFQKLWLSILKINGYPLSFGSKVKIGTIQRRLAWPQRMDDKHNSRRSIKFFCQNFPRPRLRVPLRHEK
mgnify:CR=1 FL=1